MTTTYTLHRAEDDREYVASLDDGADVQPPAAALGDVLQPTCPSRWPPRITRARMSLSVARRAGRSTPWSRSCWPTPTSATGPSWIGSWPRTPTPAPRRGRWPARPASCGARARRSRCVGRRADFRTIAPPKRKSGRGRSEPASPLFVRSMEWCQIGTTTQNLDVFLYCSRRLHLLLCA